MKTQSLQRRFQDNLAAALSRPGALWPAAFAPAIANATGKRLRDLPLTRKRIKDAILA